MNHKAKWYELRLGRYFEEHYSEYEETAEWWNNPEINQWLFDIRELGVRIELTCKDDGTVVEQRYHNVVMRGD